MGPDAPPDPDEAEGLRSRALDQLGRAFALGFADFEHARRDPGLEALRDLPAFRALLKEWEGRRD